VDLCRAARHGDERVTRRKAITAPARFLDRLRDALGHYVEGVHLLGDAASKDAIAARARALGCVLPSSFVEVYGYADGIDLFGDVVRIVRLDALAVDGDWLRCGEAEGNALLCARDGAIFEEDEDGDRLCVAADLESALLVYLAREGLIVDHEGEYREVFGTDGAITDAVQRKRNEAARKRAPGAARWIVEQAELKLELDGDEAGAEALLAEARALDPQAAAPRELHGLLLAARGANAEAALALAQAAEHSGAARRADRASVAAGAAEAQGDEGARARWAAAAVAAEPGITTRLCAEAEAAIANGRLDDADRLLALAYAVGGEAGLSGPLRSRRRLRMIR
jgi:hypothetical protein